MPRRVREVSAFERICSELGVPASRVLRELRQNGFVPAGVEIDALDRRALTKARAVAREVRMRTRTSKLWVAGYPELVREWHPTRNGDVFPDEVRFGSHVRIWWKCAKGPDHEWQARPNGRTSGRGCPFCAGQRVSVTNSLATLRPDLAPRWHPTKNGNATPATVTAQSHKQMWWQCAKDATHVWRSAPATTTGCPYCAGKRISRARTLRARAPRVAAEWHPANESSPDDIFAGSQTIARWRCSRGHEWGCYAHNRSQTAQQAQLARSVRTSACPAANLSRRSAPTSPRSGTPRATVTSHRQAWSKDRRGQSGGSIIVEILATKASVAPSESDLRTRITGKNIIITSVIDAADAPKAKLNAFGIR